MADLEDGSKSLGLTTEQEVQEWRDNLRHWQSETDKWGRLIKSRLIRLIGVIVIYSFLLLCDAVLYTPHIGYVFSPVTKGISMLTSF